MYNNKQNCWLIKVVDELASVRERIYCEAFQHSPIYAIVGFSFSSICELYV